MCGEGGEYETLTLDCPLFLRARIVLDTWQLVLHSVDSVAPVGVLHATGFHLVSKSGESVADMVADVIDVPQGALCPAAHLVTPAATLRARHSSVKHSYQIENVKARSSCLLAVANESCLLCRI